MVSPSRRFTWMGERTPRGLGLFPPARVYAPAQRSASPEARDRSPARPGQARRSPRPALQAAWGLGGSREEAEDLVQETYARVLSRPRFLRNERDLGADRRRAVRLA